MNLKQAKEIYQGFTNLIKKQFNFTEEDVEKMANHRYSICKLCEERNTITNTCNQCGCYLPAKTRSKLSSCPIGHWEAIK